MKIVKEHINFERGIDPKSSMKIGMPSWNNLHEGDLLKVIKNIPLDTNNEISYGAFPVSDLPIGVILQMEEFDNASSKEWIIWFKYFEDLEDFKANKNDNVRQRHGFIKGTPKQLKSGLFEFLPRSMNEAQEFHRGGDPMVSMNIGKRALIEKWLNEHDLLEDTVISKDLIINTPKDCQLLIRLRNIGEALPEYIQFGTVIGGFDISDNQLKTLRGCPKKVVGTENLKGNFKCSNNKLMTLEDGPRHVDGNYVCHNNPGLFSQKDIRKVCRVKGSAWGDEPQEIVDVPIKENMEFHRNINPKSSLDIGYHAQIKNWFKECGISEDPNDDKYVEYRINKDGTIDVLDDLNLVDCNINNFPYFIKFKIIYGGFYVAQNIFTKLDGFPKEVKGDLSIYSSYPGSKKWKEDEIRKKIKVLGTVWN